MDLLKVQGFFYVPSEYSQVAKVWTHLSGSLLDHCYVYKEFSKTFCEDVFEIYFSDHDRVRLGFT